MQFKETQAIIFVAALCTGCDGGDDSSGATEAGTSQDTETEGTGTETGSEGQGESGGEEDSGQADSSVDSSDSTTAGPEGDSARNACELLGETAQACFDVESFDLDGCVAAFDGAVERGCSAAHVSAFLDFIDGGGEFECSDSDIFPGSNDEEVAIGYLCPTTVLDPLCFGVSCVLDSDCGGGEVCNTETDACVNPKAFCPALPCFLDSDCPQLQTCNSALETCVIE